MSKADDKVIDSIEQTWNGGERTLAGKRASEFVFGSSKTPDQKKVDALIKRMPDLQRFIVAPAGPPVENVPDESGNPLSSQPEAQMPSTGKSNLSDNKGKAEQNEIDKALEPGRKSREKADVDKDLDHTGSTRLNPAEGKQDKPKGFPGA